VKKVSSIYETVSKLFTVSQHVGARVPPSVQFSPFHPGFSLGLKKTKKMQKGVLNNKDDAKQSLSFFAFS